MPTQIFCYSCGLAGRDPQSGAGPYHLLHSPMLDSIRSHIQSHTALAPQGNERGKDALAEIIRLNTALAEKTLSAVNNNQHFITLGGDHSSAIGTWSGAATALASQGRQLGLIWIDAHMDSHTFDTSPTNNIHGMPLAALLGHGDQALTQLCSPRQKIQPEHTFIVGARSFEPGEQALLEQLKVKVYFMPEIRERGLTAIFKEITAKLDALVSDIGVSIDIDALDPTHAPGVSTPAPDGLNAQELLQALPQLSHHDKLLGSEIVEFLPANDINQSTEQLAARIVKQFIKA